ncbi:alcohol dehydrogenase catalytic domain-containing protein [Mycolicibacterium setense]
MRATYIYGPGDVRVIEAPEPTIQKPSDALVRVVRACVCGSDLHPYHSMVPSAEGVSIGHEFIAPFAVSLEAVGHMPAYDQAIGIVRPGGVISRVGVPQYEDAPVGFGSLFGPNITLTGGPAPARAYIEPLLPAVLDGSVQPGKVFDRTVALDETPEAYAAMDSREALKVMVKPR